MSQRQLSEYAVTAAVRDVIKTIARNEIQKARPASRLAAVQSIDPVDRSAQVIFVGETEPVRVPYTSKAPAFTGQFVRIGGTTHDRYIEDVIGQDFTSLELEKTKESVGKLMEAAYGEGWFEADPEELGITIGEYLTSLDNQGAVDALAQTVEQVETTANNASTAAGQAQTTANNASTAAGQASSDASTALGKANDAEAAAGAASSQAGAASSLAEAVQTVTQQIANNINALGEGVAEGVADVADIFATIGNIFGTAINAESKAIETQTKLQELIGSNEAGASGGKSGSDDFERPNSTTLGPNWVTQTMAGDLTLQIEDGNVRLLGGSDTTLAYARWVGSNDVISDYVQTTMVVGGGWGAAGTMYDYIFARWDGLFSGSGENTTPLNCWAARLEKSGVVTLIRVVNGSMVEFGSHDIGSTAIGDVMSLRCGSYTHSRQITVVYNGEPIISYTDLTEVSMMGPAYRKHGFSMFASNVFGVQRPARIASYSFSDIPGGGIILGKGFKYYRTNTNTVTTPAASLLPTSVFDSMIMSPAIEPPGGSYAWGQGEFIIPIEGWWEFTFTFGGTTPSIAANGALDVEPRLYYGQGTLNQFIEMENQRIPRGATSSGSVTTGPLVSSIRRYCIVGERVAPGNGPSGNHMANLTGAADGNRTAFSGILLSP
ncbi:tail protein [Gordonia phage Demosthenes]|uniref:Minor tail protein n=1 Tax=Gordonia phage Demosthenes TaxID=1838067 RepID=A0A160DE01_9CAUD|nr:tail protein [Gordonia phage Demosthenes]ANA85999.1 minor tail protein [Gordonia phage Demosthenes]